MGSKLGKGVLKLKSVIENDKYTNYVYDAFDIQNREETESEIKYDLTEANDFEWNIGVIYGGSGSGKTSILKEIGILTDINFDENKPLISNFDWIEPEEATKLLSSIGLSSVPTWLRPFKMLSNGEQYRAELAYKIGKSKPGDIILIDEYTSVVDRNVAKAMSFALQKYIRKQNKKIILASCHYDIMEWLMPDWTCSPLKNGVLERDACLRRERPKMELCVSRVEADTWNFFKKHHYLTEDVNKSCKFFLFTMDRIVVAISVVITQPSGHFKNGVRSSRLVVMPDYQGLGLGSVISRFTASIYKDSGYRFFTKTVHPALGVYRNTNKDIWRGTSKNGKKPKAQNSMGKLDTWKVLVRTSYCHEYIGEGLKGYSELLQPIKEMREYKTKNDKNMEMLKTISEQDLSVLKYYKEGRELSGFEGGEVYKSLRVMNYLDGDLELTSEGRKFIKEYTDWDSVTSFNNETYVSVKLGVETKPESKPETKQKKELVFDTGELNKILIKLSKSDKDFDSKRTIINNYFNKYDSKINQNKITIHGAETMEWFKEEFHTKEDMLARAKVLCDEEIEDVDPTYLWVEYPDGSEDRMVDLIWGK